jgi:hypothetical protein
VGHFCVVFQPPPVDWEPRRKARISLAVLTKVPSMNSASPGGDSLKGYNRGQLKIDHLLCHVLGFQSMLYLGNFSFVRCYIYVINVRCCFVGKIPFNRAS